jgi:hypothetical protein
MNRRKRIRVITEGTSTESTIFGPGRCYPYETLTTDKIRDSEENQ